MTASLNLWRAIVCFVIAYLIVTILATASSVIYGMLTQSPPVAQGESILNDPAFVATVPFHVLIMLIVWPIFAWIYFQKPRSVGSPVKETIHLSLIWLLQAIVVDLIFFVLIKHPYSLTFFEFYVLYQPWISLIYLSIFVSPFIRLGLSRIWTSEVIS